MIMQLLALVVFALIAWKVGPLAWRAVSNTVNRWLDDDE